MAWALNEGLHCRGRVGDSGANSDRLRAWLEMGDSALAHRLRRLPAAVVCGREVRLAATPAARLLGLAGLRPERVGGGLLIPRCRSVHTFGMRFRLDLLFLDADGALIEERRDIGAGRVLRCRAAAAVLEAPASTRRRPG